VGGGVLNSAAQVAVSSSPVLAQWAILMSEPALRMAFEASCGLPLALLTWGLGEFTPLKRFPAAAKRFIPMLAVPSGMFLSCIVAAYVPGVQVIEAAGLMIPTAAGGSVGTHALVNKVTGKHKNPPGSSGGGE